MRSRWIGLLLLLSQAAAAGELEKAARDFGADAARYEVLENVMVPMTDGVRLSTAVMYPKGDVKAPTVLLRTPYVMAEELAKPLFRKFFENNYAVVMQNERGTHASEGDFHFLGGARKDGYQTLSWIAAQPWSNGRVGTLGCSSAAENQLALGAMRHPAHRAMIAQAAGAGIGSIPGVTSQGLFYKNGVPVLAPWAEWYATYGRRNGPKGTAFQAEFKEAMRTLPSVDALKSLGLAPGDFEAFLARTPSDPQWRNVDLITSDDTNAVPTLNVNSWGDVGPWETLKLFEFQQHHPDQYLIMAPTAHCDMLKATENTMTGDRSVGDARLPYADMYVAWFDRHLKGDSRAFTGQPKVRAYLMGANVWLTGDKWPLPGTKSERFYFHSKGRLLPESPRDAQKPDEFVDDPANPVPSWGGGCCDRRVFRDQTEIEKRPDVLVYSTPAFTKGLAVMGEVTATLFVSTTAKDTDVAVKLVYVNAAGTPYNLHDTMVRLRYRDGVDAPKLAEAGKVYRVEVTGLVSGNYFAPGDRLRVEIAGSNFPNHERNLHTGGENHTADEPRVARTRIYHDAKQASFISVPVYPKGP